MAEIHDEDDEPILDEDDAVVLDETTVPCIWWKAPDA